MLSASHGIRILVHQIGLIRHDALCDLVGRHAQSLRQRVEPADDGDAGQPRGFDLGDVIGRYRHHDRKPTNLKSEADRDEGMQVAERADRGEDDLSHRLGVVLPGR
ncbi:hypothetical protein [Sphingomonas sp. LR55]|uniref:hypothetical protein n=1 Tax=Sphingomonas sp. LR55 TaxID=3050231 RepID=UPI002FE31158